VVLGPNQHHYVIDHHHLARALHDEGVKDILVTVIADLSMVDQDAFWVVMDNRRWAYPYNSKGERCHFKDIPKSVTDLKDDPFRSLAGELRRVSGFAMDTTPFSEFLWADFLRRRMSRKTVEADFEIAIEQGLGWPRARTRSTCRAGAGRPGKRRWLRHPSPCGVPLRLPELLESPARCASSFP
jgi:hypothetical protein